MLGSITEKINLKKLPAVALGFSIAIGTFVSISSWANMPMDLNSYPINRGGRSEILNSLEKINHNLLAINNSIGNSSDAGNKGSVAGLLASNKSSNTSTTFSYDTREANLINGYSSNFNTWAEENFCMGDVTNLVQFVSMTNAKPVPSNLSSQYCRPYINNLVLVANRIFKNSNNNTVGQAVKSLEAAKKQILHNTILTGSAFGLELGATNSYNRITPQEYDSTNVILSGADVGMGEGDYSPLKNVNSVLLVDAAGDKKVSNDLIAKLGVINNLVATANEVNEDNKNSENNENLKESKSKSINNANLTELMRMLVINGDKRLKALQNIQKQNSAMLLGQAALLSIKIQNQKQKESAD